MSTAGPWALSLDTIFELLCRRRRRYALYVLYRSDSDGMGLEELASRIDRLEAGDEDGRSGGTETIETVLRERHLPRLVEAHVVDFDERSEAIRYHGQPSLEEWIEHAEFKEGKRPEE